MPFMYVTTRAAKHKNIFGFVSVYVVMVSQSWTLKPYEAGWMQDDLLSKGPTFIPDVDIVDSEDEGTLVPGAVQRRLM